MLKTLIASTLAVTILHSVYAADQQQENKTLLTRVFAWQYPKSEMSGAIMSDGATFDSEGNRTVPSTQCRAVYTTGDSVEKVLSYYKSKLVQEWEKKRPEPAMDITTDKGRSVTFHNHSADRPIHMHVIMINDSHKSTTLVITRSEGEQKTHIAWSQYQKHIVSGRE